MDDGIANVDHGLRPGDWLPIAVGSEMPTAIESKARFDVQVFEIDELRSAIRRAHYQDRPEQLGKTPPTRKPPWSRNHSPLRPHCVRQVMFQYK